MNKRELQFIALTAGMALLLSMPLFSAGKQESSSASTGGTVQVMEPVDNSWELDTTPITLELFLDGTNVFDKYWGQDPVSKKWMKDTGISIEWQYAPDSDHSKLNVLIASDDLPDLIYTKDNIPQVIQLAQYDRIWALNKLAEQSGSKLMDHIDDHVLLAKRVLWGTMDLYAAPFYQVTEKNLDEPFIVKNLMGVAVIDKIYESLGSPKLTTTGDFLDLLRKVKKNYPDMIPLQSNRSSSRDRDGNPRLVYKALPMAGLGGRFYKDGENYRKYYEHPNFLELLRFLNALYDEELLDKTEFTDDTNQLRAKMYSGRVFADMSQDADNIDWYTGEVQKIHPDWGWIMIDPPGISKDIRYANDSFGGGKPSNDVLLVPKSTKYPERIGRWLDYMYTDEVQKEIIFGLEGEGYTMENGRPVAVQAVTDFYNADMEAAKLQYGLEIYYIFRIGDYAAMKRLNAASDRQAAAHAVTGKYYEDYSFYSGVESYSPDSEEVKIDANLKEYYSVQIMKLIMSEPEELEPRYHTMLDQMKKLGLEDLRACWNSYFAEKQEIIDRFSQDL